MSELRELLWFSRRELLLSEAGTRGRGQLGHPGNGEHPSLEAATKKRLGKTEKTLFVL